MITSNRLSMHSLLNVLRGFNPYGVTIDLNTRIIEDLGLDSLTIVQLVIVLENEYDIAIPDEEVNRKNFLTIRELHRYLLAKARKQVKRPRPGSDARKRSKHTVHSNRPR